MQTAIIKHLVPTKSSELIADCRKLASERLPTSLGVALNQVDDALFDLANTADNSLRQNLYFDAMRELRIKRAEFENSFIQSFDTNFENSLDLTKAHREEQGLNVATDLALVETDEVEQTLAVINFADSMKSRCRDELFALDKRIGLLLRKPELDDADNPLGPQAIGDALRKACEHLDADIEVKLTLFKLFDKFASVLIHELYRDINQYLVRSDVLPTITTPTPRQGRTRKTRVIIESEQDSVDDAGEDVFSTLQQMMQAQPCGGAGGVAGGVGRAPAGGAQSASAATAAAGGASVISAIVDALTVLQRADSANPSEPIWDAVDQDQIAAGNVNVLRGLRESGVVSDLGPSENLTIDIVSLLFDYILDDPAIPDGLKALIGRLQIPVLKVAMLDKDVFSKKTHPARRLLDAFAGASIGWSEGLRQQDALYDKIEEIVRRIVAEFDDDVDVFQQVLDEFNAFIEEESQAADVRAEKSSQSLHTKERIVLTKMEVDKQINARFDGREIREFVSHFILDYWRQLLIITHIEVGADSDEWRGQMQTIDDLLWSVQAKKTPAERKELTARLPKLIKDIKGGMQKLEMEPVQCSKFLSMLASVHVVSVKNVEETSIAERKLADADDRLRIERQAAQARGEIGPSSEEFIKKGLARLFERQGVEETELDIDLSLFESPDESAQDKQTDSIDTNIMEFVQMVTTLDLGDWIEFEDADDVTLRARFTWISPSTGRYLFTTRQGQKALDTTLEELAEQFQRGHARIIESAPDPLFDRAIGDLIEKLEAGAASA